MSFSSLGERLALVIDGNAAGGVKAVKQVGDASQKEFTRAESSRQKWSTGLIAGGATAIGVAAVIGKGLKSTVDAYEESQAASTRLGATISKMPQLAGANRKAFDDLAQSTVDKTRVDDEAVTTTESMLGQFGETQAQILKLTPLIVDYSVKTGVDMVTATKSVEKGLLGQGRALAANGVELDKGKLKTDAYDTVVAGLSKTVGGFAEKDGKTFSGQLAIMSNQLENFKEGVGQGVVEELASFSGALLGASTGLGHMSQGTEESIGKILTLSTIAIGGAGAVATLAGAAIKAKTALTVADGATGVFGTSLTGIGAAAVGTGLALGALGVITEIFKHKQQDAGKAVNDTIDAMLKEGKTAKEVAASQLVDYIKDHQEIPNIANAAGISLKDLAAAIGGNADAYDRVKAKAHDYLVSQQRGEDDLVKSQHLHGQAVADLNKQDEERKKHIGQVTDFVDQYRKSISDATKKDEVAKSVAKDLAAATTDQATSTQQAAQASKDMANALQNQREEAERLTEKTLDVADASRNLRDRERAMTTSLLDVHDKQVAYTQAVKDHGKGSEEAIRAELDLQASLDGVGQASDDAKRAVIDLAVKQTGAANATDAVKNNTAAFVTHLLAVRNTLAPGSALRKFLDDYISKLQAVPSEISTRFVVSGNTAAVTFAGGHIQGDTGRDLGNQQPPGPKTALGGVFDTPQERTIAEAGAEAVVPLTRPGRAAEVMRQAGLLAPAGAGVSEEHFHFHLHVTPTLGADAARFARELAEMIGRDARTGGPIQLALRKARAA